MILLFFLTVIILIFMAGKHYAFFTWIPKIINTWASGLKKRGYATNPKYAPILLSSLIEDYNLNQYTPDRDGGKCALQRKCVATGGPKPAVEIPVTGSYGEASSRGKASRKKFRHRCLIYIPRLLVSVKMTILKENSSLKIQEWFTQNRAHPLLSTCTGI